jgi:hypothetical protein
MSDGTIKKDDIIGSDVKSGIDEVTRSLKLATDQMAKFLASINMSAKSLSDETQSIRDLNKVQTENNDLAKQLETANGKLQRALTAVAQETVKASLSKKELNEKTKQETILNSESSGEMEKLRARIKLLYAEREKLKKTDEDYSESLKKNTALIKLNEESLSKLKTTTQKQKDEIGNYSGALDKLVPGLGSTIQGIKGMTKAAWEFIATPLGLVLAAIGVAALSVKEYFTQTEEGQNKWNKITNESKAIWQTFKDKLSDAGKAILDTGDKSSKLGTIIKDQLINRVAGLVMAYDALAKVLHGHFKEAFVEAGQAIVQTLTGIEIGNNKVTEAFRKEMEERKKIADEYSDIQAAFDKKEREDEIELAKLRLEAAESREKSMQKDKYTTEQLIAFKEQSINAEKKEMEIELEQAKSRLIMAKEKLAIGAKDKENLDAVASAEANLFDVRANYFQGIKKLEGSLAEFRITLSKEALEVEKNNIAQNLAKLKDAKGEERDQINITLKNQLAAYEKDIQASNLLKLEKETMLGEAQKQEIQIQSENTAYTKKVADEILKENVIAYNQLVDANKTKADQIKSDDKDLTIAKVKTNEDLLTKLIQNNQAYLDESYEDNLISDDEYTKATEKNAQDGIAIHKNAKDQEFAINEKHKAKLKELREGESKEAMNILKNTASLFNNIENNRISKLEASANKEKNMLDKQAKQRIANGENEQKVNEEIAAKKTALDQKTAIESAKIKRKMALIDKISSMADVAINTAVGISKAVKDSELTMGMPWSALILASGIIQEAAIAAKPLPEIPSFKKGTKNAPGGLSILHGGELVELPSGKKYLTLGGIDTPIPSILPEHSKVTSNSLLREQIMNLPHQSKDEQAMSNQILSQIAGELRKDKPVVEVHIDETGFNISQTSNRGRINYINNRFRGKA